MDFKIPSTAESFFVLRSLFYLNRLKNWFNRLLRFRICFQQKKILIQIFFSTRKNMQKIYFHDKKSKISNNSAFETNQIYLKHNK